MRFSVRELLLVTLVVAVVLGWCIDRSALSRKSAEWEKAFAEPLRQLATVSKDERTFDTPSGPWTVNRRPDPESQARRALRRVIHVCDWHYVAKDVFAADLRSGGTYSDENIEEIYAAHLDDVEAVQADQVEHLRSLI